MMCSCKTGEKSRLSLAIKLFMFPFGLCFTEKVVVDHLLEKKGSVRKASVSATYTPLSASVNKENTQASPISTEVNVHASYSPGKEERPTVPWSYI